MTEYDEVKCRVPKGGETLIMRHPAGGESFISDAGNRLDIPRDGNPWGSVRAVIIPTFNREIAEKFAEENLPKPACKQRVWACMDDDGVWCLCERRPDTRVADRVWWQGGPETVIASMMPEKWLWPADWTQARFEWCECSILGQPERLPQHEWRWIWRPEGGAE